MALNIGGILGQVGGILGATNTTQNPYVAGLGGIMQIAGQSIKPSTMKVTTSAPMKSSPALMAAGIVPSATAGKLTKEIFDAGAKVLNRLGVPFKPSAGSFTTALKRTLSSVASLARRTPSGTMVSLLIGIGLTAMEAYILTSWQAQKARHRRMNPANAKALKRSVRRIKAFHRLCGEADVIKPRRRSFPTRGCAKAC